MSPSRVVHLSSVHRANDPRIFEKECASLHEAGYDVTLIATGEVPTSNFRVIAFPKSPRRLVRMTWGTARAVRAALRLRPHLVHLHDPELLPWIVVFRACRIRVVFDSHEDIAASMSYKGYLGPWTPAARVFSRILLRIVDRTATGIVAATPSIADGFNNTRKAVVQNFPILDEWTTSARPPDSPQLVYIGSLSEERGAVQMLDIMCEIGPSHNATLAIAGWVSEDLLDSLRAHPGFAYVKFLGSLSRREVLELLATSTIGVVVFQPSPNHVSSQPTKMFEYMAAGLPVLASDFPLWRELIMTEQVGVVADPCETSSLVSAARRLLEDPVATAEMGGRGRLVAERHHSWSQEALVLHRFYEELLHP